MNSLMGLRVGTARLSCSALKETLMTALPLARRLPALLAAATTIVALAAAPAAASPRSEHGTSSDPARAALARMSTEQKIGQLFETYAYGSSATDVTPAEA